MRRATRIRARPLLVLVVAVAALAEPARPAIACTPPPGGLPTLTAADRTRAAEVVLEGTVTAMQDNDIPGETATVAVDRYFKGQGPATITIRGFGPGSICRSEVRIGQHLIFYAAGDPSSELQAKYLSQFDAVAPAEAQTVAEVIAAAGRQPAPPGPPPASLPPTATASLERGSQLVVLLACALLGLGGALLWVRRRQG